MATYPLVGDLDIIPTNDTSLNSLSPPPSPPPSPPSAHVLWYLSCATPYDPCLFLSCDPAKSSFCQPTKFSLRYGSCNTKVHIGNPFAEQVYIHPYTYDQTRYCLMKFRYLPDEVYGGPNAGSVTMAECDHALFDPVYVNGVNLTSLTERMDGIWFTPPPPPPSG